MEKFNREINIFKDKGFRITNARKKIIEIFTKNTSPISAFELKEKLEKSGLLVNKTTVYRELYFLLTEKFIREINLLDGTKRYEKIIPNDHHHHIICTKCRDIKCISTPDDLDKLGKSIS